MPKIWGQITDRLAGPPVAAPPPPSPIMQGSFATTLPSIVDGAHFRASVTASWLRNEVHDDGGSSIVKHRLSAWAAQQSVRWSPTQYEVLGSELTLKMNSLGRTQEGVEVLGGSVALAVTSDAEKAGVEWDGMQRQLALNRLRFEVELTELKFLREEVFSQPIVARSYWLKRHPDAIGDILDDRFERVAEKLGAVPEATSDLMAASLLTDFVQGLSVDERRYLLAQLGHVFASFGRDDLAKRLPE